MSARLNHMQAAPRQSQGTRMVLRAGLLAGAVFVAGASCGVAQSAPSDKPLSAIDWLSNSVALPPPSFDNAILPPKPDEPATSKNASVAAVTSSPLGAPVLDALGLLSPSATGIARNIWGQSRPDDLARRMLSLDLELMPAMQGLLTRLLLTELDPPQGASAADDRLFLARIDRLLSVGALDQADALLTRAGNANPRVFQRSFDTAILLGHEDRQCEALRDNPALSPTFTARVFCLARGGDWDGAVLTLGTGNALGYISQEDDTLLARFLDPELFEGEAPLPVPDSPTPLTFRMFEAIGEHISTNHLPLAFAQSDLRANIGWKARAEAGERLARVGSVTPNQILGLYSERKPAASGGIWDRMTALRKFEQALNKGVTADIGTTLSTLWPHLEDASIEAPFARLFGHRLTGLDLQWEARIYALSMGLLSENPKDFAAKWTPSDKDLKEDFLLALAQGEDDALVVYDDQSRAIADAFSATEVPVRLRSLVDQDRLGEAILRAIALYSTGVAGDYDELSDALAFLRLVGFEPVARQAALEFLILERRG